MKAMILTAAGQPLVQNDIAKPAPAWWKRLAPAAGQVLVRIHASAVNPLDLKIAAGKAAHARMPLPAVLGIDMAGVVEAVGAGVTAFAPGDAVFGMTGGVGGVQGSLAEYAAVDADLLAHAPSTISLREAAAIPLAFITAWEGLVDRARVQPGQSVLVQGGAGGVGRMVVQLAQAFGAQVAATGRPAQRESIEAMGARFLEQAEGEEFDIVYDTIGGEVLDASFRLVREYSGHVVSALGWGTHALAPLSFRAASYSGVFTLLPLLSGKGRAAHGAILREAARLVDAGKLSVQLNAGRFTLAEANEAHAASGGGKVVVDIA
jgi:NADPH:quinone reductase-like Zn-dependent oxidoreductase